ncbi:MAG: hypothetical protein AAFN27_14505 [Pseudomonadota bacterium]
MTELWHRPDDRQVGLVGADPRSGARNLLLNCAGLLAGQRIVLLAEDPALGWYDDEAPRVTAEVAREMGGDVTVLPVGGPDAAMPPGVDRIASQADIVVFFARIGDQARFSARRYPGICVMVYARTATALGSPFGTRPHSAMQALKNEIHARVFGARQLHVSCPKGTELTGLMPRIEPEHAADVTILRFPMCVPAPVPAATFSGRVALSGWLTPTGSRAYHPASLKLEHDVIALVENGRIAGFDGPSREVEAIRRHYDRVAKQFDLDADAVHSFHAGIHDGCAHPCAAEDDPDLWSNTVFGSPRYLHVHTCGAEPPGEICWMVENPTVSADGIAIWSNGTLIPAH